MSTHSTQLKHQGAHEWHSIHVATSRIFAMWFWLCRCFVTAFCCQVMVQSDCARGQTWQGVIVQGFLPAEQWAITWHHHDEDDIQKIFTGILDWKISFHIQQIQLEKFNPLKHHPKLDVFKDSPNGFDQNKTPWFASKKSIQWKITWFVSNEKVSHGAMSKTLVLTKKPMDSQESGNEVPERLQLAESLQWG